MKLSSAVVVGSQPRLLINIKESMKCMLHGAKTRPTNDSREKRLFPGDAK
jgi:hypothetical protein